MKTVTKRNVVILIATVILIAIFYWWRLSSMGGGFAGFNAPTIVEVAAVQSEDMPQSIQAFGTLVAPESATLSVETSGKVAEFFKSSGAWVKEGEPLLRLDNEIAKAELAAQESDLKLNLQNFKRIQDLLEKKAISKEAFDDAKAKVDRSEALVAVAKAKFERMTLKAPFAGRLSNWAPDLGTYVNVGEPLIDLVHNRKLIIDYQVPQRFVSKLQLGQKVELTMQAFPGETFNGTVSYIAPRVDKTTRSIKVRAEVPNDNERITAGLSAKLIQEVAVNKNAIVIPDVAVISTLSGKKVFRVNDDKAELITIVTGSSIEGKVEVLSGLEQGDVIVISGHQKLHDGSAIKIAQDNNSDSDNSNSVEAQ